MLEKVIDNHSHSGLLSIHHQGTSQPPMYVCLCKAVTDSDIIEAANGGVRTMRQLARETGCSSNCGRCAVTAAEILGQVASQGGSSNIEVVSQSHEPSIA
jgi:bacterioferritin-associated ferredoxin